MTPKLYTKKPLSIEAIQLDNTNCNVVAKWCNGRVRYRDVSVIKPDLIGIIIPTLEGDMSADLGDYIIKGIKGEFYPCKPDIFEASYNIIDYATVWPISPDVSIPTTAAEFSKLHMQTPEPVTKVWAPVADVVQGTIVQVFGIPCIGKDGSFHNVHSNAYNELYLDCEDGHHFLKGQIEYDHYIGIVLSK